MYCKTDTKNTEKFWLVWKLRSNDRGETWLAKEDCPSVVHTDYIAALKEADRLCTIHKTHFVVLEARDVARPPRQFTSEIVALRDRR